MVYNKWHQFNEDSRRWNGKDDLVYADSSTMTREYPCIRSPFVDTWAATGKLLGILTFPTVGVRAIYYIANGNDNQRGEFLIEESTIGSMSPTHSHDFLFVQRVKNEDDLKWCVRGTLQQKNGIYVNHVWQRRCINRVWQRRNSFSVVLIEQCCHTGERHWRTGCAISCLEALFPSGQQDSWMEQADSEWEMQ